MNELQTDVVVVGAGNAALCAALSAREQGAEVIVLEAASAELRGGNSRFTGGSVRLVYKSVEDLQKIYAEPLSEEELAISDFGAYTAEDFFDDMGRLTHYRTDPDLCEVLVTKAYDSVLWVRSKGVKYIPSYGRQAYKVDGRFKFFGGIAVNINGGGEHLVEALFKAAEREGVRVMYRARAQSLVLDDDTVVGVDVRHEGKPLRIRARSVVLGCGGFESNREWRTRYLGPGWDVAKVRGTRFNNGDGLRMAMDVGAQTHGNWAGCHAVSWDLNAPDFGDLTIGTALARHSYPFSVMINAEGRRFVDEGADFQGYTYAKYGGAVLAQPGQFAWQIFDQTTAPFQRDVYRGRRVSKVTANTLEELAGKLEGVDGAQFLKTIAEFNAAVQTDRPFDPNVRDGRCTTGLELPKSNWSSRIETPPYEAYPVTCGITFTFGGIHINTRAHVLDVEERPIPGLFACGEMVGGLFYFNYPVGSGLASGTVFGKIAGEEAGKRAKG